MKMKQIGKTTALCIAALALLTTGQRAWAKSIRDLRLGNVTLGYQYTGGVEATGASTLGTSRSKASFGGFTLGLRKQGFRFFGDKARLSWDTSLVLASIESGLPSPTPSQSWSLEGTLLNIRTGPGIEVRLTDSLLFKLGTGMDTAYLDASLQTTTKLRDKGWHFGGHVDGSLFYVPNPSFSIYGGGGLERIGEQKLGDGADHAILDLSSNWTLSTGMAFRW